MTNLKVSKSFTIRGGSSKIEVSEDMGPDGDSVFSIIQRMSTTDASEVLLTLDEANAVLPILEGLVNAENERLAKKQELANSQYEDR